MLRSLSENDIDTIVKLRMYEEDLSGNLADSIYNVCQ